MFWLTDLSFSGSSRHNTFTEVDPLSEGNLRESQPLSADSSLPLEARFAPDTPPIAPAATLYYRDPAHRAPDPSGGPVLIPLPPAVATGLVTLGGAIVIAIRPQLRRR
jgi:hypothetical protein